MKTADFINDNCATYAKKPDCPNPDIAESHEDNQGTAYANDYTMKFLRP